MRVKWLDKPEKLDAKAAEAYLGLTMEGPAAKAAVAAIHDLEMTSDAAKDIFRAPGLPLLGVSSVELAINRSKILADGYHRVCAVYKFDEDGLIPCQIA
jgi:hypothetical protein